MDYQDKETLKDYLSQIMHKINDTTDFIDKTTTIDDDKYIRIGEKLVDIWNEIYNLRQEI